MTDKIVPRQEDKLQVGDVIISDSGRLLRVTEIDDRRCHYCYLDDDEYGSSFSLDRFGYYKYRWVSRAPEDGDYNRLVAELEAEALETIQDPSHLQPYEIPSDTTALVTSSGPERLEMAVSDLNKKRLKAEILGRIIQRKVNAITSMVSEMNKQIKKLKKVIGIFELYLGVEEEIVQLTDGQRESPNTPVSIRQLVLYMDEEVGDPTEGGIDFRRVDDFDDWVVDNFKLLIPETKGMVVMRPSRQKRWQRGRFGEFLAVQKDDYRCYLLIRNGDVLYRIFTGISHIGAKFFPSPSEFEEIVKTSREGRGFEQQDAEELHLFTIKNAMLVQGLIDRTPVFSPYSERPDMLKGEPLINVIWDAELTLPDGQMTFDEWHEWSNDQIKRGSRVIIGPVDWYRRTTDGRFIGYRNYPPPAPKQGLYTVEKVEPHKYYKNAFIIKYNPKDEVAGRWYQDWHERKNRLSFRLYPSDDFVFNYDLLDLVLIERFLNSRIERVNYLKVIPLLWEMRKQRLEEMEWEEYFVKLVAHETGKPEKEVWAAVEWWKNRVIWKRPITKDDAKAHRMITRHLGGAWSHEKLEGSK